jgi:hypothetical protein
MPVPHATVWHVTPVPHVIVYSDVPPHAMPGLHVTACSDAPPHVTPELHVMPAHSALAHYVPARFEPAQNPFSGRMPLPEPPAIPSALPTSAESLHS